MPLTSTYIFILKVLNLLSIDFFQTNLAKLNRTSSECGVFAWNERAYIEYFKQEMQKRVQKNLNI